MQRSALCTFLAMALAFGAGAAQAQDIAIAVVGPITGSNAALGEQMTRGAKMAVADINAKGGVLGKKLNLIIADDACDPKQAVSVANDLASKGVVFVAGHYCSSSSIPASDVYAESNIVQISPGSTNVKLTDRGLANVFRVCGRDDAQGPIAAEYVAKMYRLNVETHEALRPGGDFTSLIRDTPAKRFIIVGHEPTLTSGMLRGRVTPAGGVPAIPSPQAPLR